MASAAAATAPGRWKRREKERARRRARLERERKIRSERGKQAFDKLLSAASSCGISPDETSNTIDESELPDFVAFVLDVPVETLEVHAIELVRDTTRKIQQQQQHSSTPSKIKQGRLERDALLQAMEKYGEYVKKSQTIDRIYQKFDSDHNGLLSRTELRRVLDNQERQTPRSIDGIQVRLIVSNQDLDIIFDVCDVDGDGAIRRSELLPALAAWEELATVKVQEQRDHNNCLLCTIVEREEKHCVGVSVTRTRPGIHLPGNCCRQSLRAAVTSSDFIPPKEESGMSFFRSASKLTQIGRTQLCIFIVCAEKTAQLYE